MAELRQVSSTFRAAVAQLASDGVAIRYVLPVLWMTSCFHGVGSMVRHFFSSESATDETTVSLPTKFCSAMKISNYIVASIHQGRNMLTTIALLTHCKQEEPDWTTRWHK